MAVRCIPRKHHTYNIRSIRICRDGSARPSKKVEGGKINEEKRQDNGQTQARVEKGTRRGHGETLSDKVVKAPLQKKWQAGGCRGWPPQYDVLSTKRRSQGHVFTEMMGVHTSRMHRSHWRPRRIPTVFGGTYRRRPCVARHFSIGDRRLPPAPAGFDTCPLPIHMQRCKKTVALTHNY